MTTDPKTLLARRYVQILILLSLTVVSSAQSQWVQTGGISSSVYALAGNGASIYAGTWGDGIHRSTNNGLTWSTINAGSALVYIYSLAITGDTLFAGTRSHGIFRSTNEGASWTPVNSGLSGTEVRTILIVGGDMFAGTNLAICRSTDRGESWSTQLSFGAACLAHSGAMLFAGPLGGWGVYRSTNNGVTWEPTSNGLPTNAPADALVASGENLLVTVAGTIYGSTDYGANWANVSDGLRTSSKVALAASGTHVVAGCNWYDPRTYYGGGVFHSADDCAPWWSSFGTGLPDMEINVIGFTDSNIFVGTEKKSGTATNGLWRRPISDMDTSREYPTNQRGFLHGSIFSDANGNGVRDSGEQVQSRQFIELSGKQSGITMSDCDGTFSFSGLDSGLYSVSVPRRYFPLYASFPPLESYTLLRTVDDSSGYFDFGIALAHGKISGTVFTDENHNGIQDSVEPGRQGILVNLTGRGAEHVWTDAYGNFAFLDLPPGTYSVAAAMQLPWLVETPPGKSFLVTIAVDDSSTDNNFGTAYPWGSIEGKIFWDVNENGIHDSVEQPLSNWLVKLAGDTNDSTVTDSGGNYLFPHVDRGLHVVYPATPLPWENVPLTHGGGDTIDYADYDKHTQNVNFALHITPKRIRLKITVHDNTQYLRRDLYCGIRSGATGGIWGADGHSTNIDFSEGEGELPPRSFAEFLGLFDARFRDPGGAIGWFGDGSWTDMRNFYWSEQTDKYRIAVLPGYSSGGDYPITLKWSRDSVRSSFKGAVTLDDQHGTVFDMKTRDSIVVTNRDVEYLVLTAQGPLLPSIYAAHWDLLSSPNVLPASNFSSARSALYAYTTGSGYVQHDSLVEGTGYWLKFARALDTFPRIGASNLKDTLHLALGWNLIGALGVPVDVRSVLTNPSDLVGRFYYFNDKYIDADSLKPEYGYWVKAKQAGDLFLDANAPSTVAKREIFLPSLENASVLHIADALGREATLYFGAGEASGDHDVYEVPPFPPDGVFDVRFATNRIYESGSDNLTRKVPIVISSAIYPISVRWEVASQSVSSSLLVGESKTQLSTDGSMVVSNAEASIILSFGGSPDLPVDFGLDQNFPNPFNPVTKISYQLPVESEVSLKVCNILGQQVAELVKEVQEPGYKSIEWNAGNVASGIYFYRLDAAPSGAPGGVFTQIRKMLVIK